MVLHRPFETAEETGKVRISTRMRYAMDGVQPFILRYRSGEEIKNGDRVVFHGNPAEIELVSTDPSNPEQEWHVTEFGGGVLVSDPTVSGRTFIPRDQLDEYEDLEFVSRAGP